MLNKLKAFGQIFTVTALLYITLLPTYAQASVDPLPSWNEGAAKQAIIEFVQATTSASSPDCVPPSERIATFDQDGTLWVEKPIYTQVIFAVERIKALAPEHPEWKTMQPFASLIGGDYTALAKFALPDIAKIVEVTHSGMTVEQFNDIVKQWLNTAKHPYFARPYTQLAYKPMLDVINYMQVNGYQTYIVTGGGQDFVRAYSQDIYGIPPQRVIGTAATTKYEYTADGKPQLIKLSKVMLVDDQEGKPSAINLVIGRIPRVAFGNSTGDKQMLEWTQSGGSKRLMMLINHDDAKREYSYGPDSKIGTFSDALKAEAKEKGWLIVSMKNDWKTIFK